MRTPPPPVTPALPEFQRWQFAFTAHIRDPRAVARPAGVESRRMAIYNRLLYDNLEGFLLACYPVLRRMLGARRWARLVRAFFREHRCRTPFFRQIPDEFLHFLQHAWPQSAGYPQYLIELAHYEWIELGLSVSTREVAVAVDPAGDLLGAQPVLNPVLANLHYAWPVHAIRPRARVRPAETWLLVYRDAADAIRFDQINAFTARLIALLDAGTLTGRAALETIAQESRHPDPAALVRGGSAALADLRARGAIVGTRV